MLLLLISRAKKKETKKTSKGSIRNTLVSCMLTIMQIITHIVHTEGWQYTQPFACSLQCRMFQQVALKAAALWTTITTGNTKRNVQHKKAFVLTHVCISPYPALKSHYLIYSVIVYCYYSTKTCKEKIKMSNVKARKALMSKIYGCGLRLIMGIFQGGVTVQNRSLFKY